jgi:uncharacterized damage-inducible protein DinB
MSTAVAPLPDSYRTLPTDLLLRAYETAPERLREALSGLTADQLRARPIPGKWSIVEIAVHLTDSELMGATRIRLALAEPGASLVVYDQTRWAEAFRYVDASPAEVEQAIALFGAVRAATAPLFHSVSGDDWERRYALHPEFGTLTLRALLELYADHGDRHIAQILERRRLLGAPTEVELLLPERLY